MGQPKALLPWAEDVPLARYQADLLRAAGADPVIIVAGSNATTLVATLASPVHRVVINDHWETGRLSSLQAGLRALPEQTMGAVILPVDTVGVQPATIERLLTAADALRDEAIRPCWSGQPGRIVWLGRAMMNELLRVESTPDFRLDAWLKPRESHLVADDPAILNNINTPAEWQALRRN